MQIIIIAIVLIAIGLGSFGGAIVYVIRSGNRLSSKEAHQAETKD